MNPKDSKVLDNQQSASEWSQCKRTISWFKRWIGMGGIGTLFIDLYSAYKFISAEEG